MAGAQPCDCNTDCRELKNVHHAISCLKHNPGGYAHNKLRDTFCSYLRRYTPYNVEKEPHVEDGERTDFKVTYMAKTEDAEISKTAHFTSA